MAAPACTRRSSAGKSPRRFSTATLMTVNGVLRSWLSEASSVSASSAFCRTRAAAHAAEQEFVALERNGDDAGEAPSARSPCAVPQRTSDTWFPAAGRASARCRVDTVPRALASAVSSTSMSIATLGSALVDRQP